MKQEMKKVLVKESRHIRIPCHYVSKLLHTGHIVLLRTFSVSVACVMLNKRKREKPDDG